jgi:hypothetical protein
MCDAHETAGEDSRIQDAPFDEQPSEADLRFALCAITFLAVAL